MFVRKMLVGLTIAAATVAAATPAQAATASYSASASTVTTINDGSGTLTLTNATSAVVTVVAQNGTPAFAQMQAGATVTFRVIAPAAPLVVTATGNAGPKVWIVR